VHEDLAGGSHAGRRAPGELFRRDGFGQGDELSRNMDPFSVESLPKAFHGICLRMHGHRGKNHTKKQCFHVLSFLEIIPDSGRPAAVC
jgi:hypothetical protein